MIAKEVRVLILPGPTTGHDTALAGEPPNVASRQGDQPESWTERKHAMNRRSASRRPALTALPNVVLLLVGLTPIVGNRVEAREFGDRVACVWKTEEFVLTNRSWLGNPFDLVATVTFTHAKEVRRTEMFYVGSDTWRFRFTGTRTGGWRFSTSSRDADLDGHTGSITVRPRANYDIQGFLTHVGNKYAVMDEDIDDLEGYVYQVFMDQQDYEQQYKHPSRILGTAGRAIGVDRVVGAGVFRGEQERETIAGHRVEELPGFPVRLERLTVRIRTIERRGHKLLHHDDIVVPYEAGEGLVIALFEVPEELDVEGCPARDRRTAGIQGRVVLQNSGHGAPRAA